MALWKALNPPLRFLAAAEPGFAPALFLPPTIMLDRRHFLSAATGCLVSTPGLAQASSPRLKKGFMLATFPDRKLPLMDKFRLLKEAGFDGVEPAIAEPVEDVLRARDATGLAIASMSCGGVTRLFASALPPARAKAVEEMKAGLRNAQRYGARSVLVVPGVVDEKSTYQQNWDRCTECIRACLPVAEETGVIMAIENVWNHFLQGPRELADFVDQFGSKRVAVHFDIGNMMFLGWPEQWLPMLGARVACVHVKEFSRKKYAEEGSRQGFQVEYLEGDNDWPATMQALRGIGYQGWIIAEPAYRPKDAEPLARLRLISERMDKMLAM